MSVRSVIDRYYECVNAGDWEGWLGLFDEHLVMDEQLAGHLEGLTALRGAVSGIQQVYSRFQNTPRYFVIDGAQACVVSHISATSAGGKPIEAEVANYFLIQDGKIAYMANFHDSVPFAPILEPQPRQARESE
ncbi:nuclear transport factor 2 family protein [Corallococcus macrosporus]|uniref:Nuclear transport factor 2 family protein n=1 Tax=Corallococcus macrosporus TaxID=35 RepID=A0ABS3DJL9_9BACT|nr:nuclear transport factor 2 family protein [Corallococcus macrosporus]MBN8231529.1 nuclear transport factor 2 family protein [Corallococcus macrosporus]